MDSSFKGISESMEFDFNNRASSIRQKCDSEVHSISKTKQKNFSLYLNRAFYEEYLVKY